MKRFCSKCGGFKEEEEFPKGDKKKTWCLLCKRNYERERAEYNPPIPGTVTPRLTEEQKKQLELIKALEKAATSEPAHISSLVKMIATTDDFLTTNPNRKK